MTDLGLFEPELHPSAWFDHELPTDGWFDPDLIQQPAGAPAAPVVKQLAAIGVG